MREPHSEGSWRNNPELNTDHRVEKQDNEKDRDNKNRDRYPGKKGWIRREKLVATEDLLMTNGSMLYMERGINNLDPNSLHWDGNVIIVVCHGGPRSGRK